MKRGSFSDAGENTCPRRLAFTLKDVKREDELPLHVLFDKAMKVLNRIGARPGEDKTADPLPVTPLWGANWLAKWAIRAVCEAILVKGMMPLPLAVDMCWKDGSRNFPSVVLPVLFMEYARQQNVNPRFLAEMILAKFMENPPAKLAFETSYPLDTNEVLPGDEWKLPGNGDEDARTRGGE